MIREINIDDIEEINKLLKTFNFELANNSLDDGFLRVIIYIEDTIKGVLVYDLIYDRIEIEYIIVDNKYRRLGIATKLLNYLETNNENIDNITLEVRESNNNAIKFYKKNGFKEAAYRKNYYRNENGILMIKKKDE